MRTGFVQRTKIWSPCPSRFDHKKTFAEIYTHSFKYGLGVAPNR